MPQDAAWYPPSLCAPNPTYSKKIYHNYAKQYLLKSFGAIAVSVAAIFADSLSALAIVATGYALSL